MPWSFPHNVTSSLWHLRRHHHHHLLVYQDQRLETLEGKDMTTLSMFMYPYFLAALVENKPKISNLWIYIPILSKKTIVMTIWQWVSHCHDKFFDNDKIMLILAFSGKIVKKIMALAKSKQNNNKLNKMFWTSKNECKDKLNQNIWQACPKNERKDKWHQNIWINIAQLLQIEHEHKIVYTESKKWS